MKKRLIAAFILCCVFVLNCTSTEAHAAQEHYFVTSLNAFIKEAQNAGQGNNIGAALMDLDGDGSEEMILAYGNVYGYAKLAVYDAKTESSATIALDVGNGLEAYISTVNNYLIANLNWESGPNVVYQYKDGKLVLLTSLSTSFNEYWAIDERRVSKSEYQQAADKYGVNWDFNNYTKYTKKVLYDADSAYNNGYKTVIEKIRSMRPAVETPTKTSVNVTVNGNLETFESSLYSINGRIQFPFREGLEKMGATVSWNANTKTATGILGANKVEFTVGSNTYKVNGSEKKMDDGVVALIIEDRIYIPIRYSAEALGHSVNWDSSSSTITIIGKSSANQSVTAANVNWKSIYSNAHANDSRKKAYHDIDGDSVPELVIYDDDAVYIFTIKNGQEIPFYTNDMMLNPSEVYSHPQYPNGVIVELRPGRTGVAYSYIYIENGQLNDKYIAGYYIDYDSRPGLSTSEQDIGYTLNGNSCSEKEYMSFESQLQAIPAF